MIARRQLLALGFTRHAIGHRVQIGRLTRVFRGVYAVGRPELSRHGMWMAATLSCRDGAVISHLTAAALWGIRAEREQEISLSSTGAAPRPQAGIQVHRRREIAHTTHHGILVTDVVTTIVDIAPLLPRDDLEAAINEADKLRLVNPERLRRELVTHPRQPGLAIVKRALDVRTFTLTDTQLERRFLPLARKAGLPRPLTQRWMSGHRVDFYWPDLNLVVETDGLTYHRTPAQQAKDRVRDQDHAAAGRTPLRFTRAQVRYEPERVQRVLKAVAQRLGAP